MNSNSKQISKLNCLRRNVKDVVWQFLNDCTDIVVKNGFSRCAFDSPAVKSARSMRELAHMWGVPEDNRFFSDAEEMHTYCYADVLDDAWMLKDRLYSMTSDGGVLCAIVVCDDGYVMFGRR